MDAGKQLLQDEKRQQRAADVQIQFIDGNHFNVLAKEDEFEKKNPELIKHKKGEIKYYGVLVSKEPNARDFCTCESAWYGNTDEFKKASPTSFQCKHLHAARKIRYGGARIMAQQEVSCTKCGGIHKKTETIYDRDEFKLIDRLEEIRKSHKIKVLDLKHNYFDGESHEATYEYLDIEATN